MTKFVLTACAVTSISLPFSHAANILLGSGEQSSFFTLQSPNIGTRIYEVSYDLAQGSTRDAAFLLLLIDSLDDAISVQLANFGSAQDPNFFLQNISFNGLEEAGSNDENTGFLPAWVHSVAGGTSGFGEDIGTPRSDTEWTLGSGISGPFRTISDGSNDAFVFSSIGFSELPSIAPVPEASTALLGLLGLSLTLRRKRS